MLARRSLLCALTMFASAASGFARAEEQAAAIVKRAIKAAGMPDSGYRYSAWTEDGVFTGGGFSMRYVSEWAYEMPDKYRFSLSGEMGGQKFNIVAAYDGKTAWESAMGMTREVTGPKLETMRNEAHQFQVLSLTPLVRDRRFQIKAIGERKVGNAATNVVQVDRRERPTVRLFFDKKSGLVVKSEMLNKDEFQAWKEVLDECFLEDHRKVDGRMLFHKIRVVREGKLMIDAKLSNQKFPNGLDAKLFAKPAA